MTQLAANLNRLRTAARLSLPELARLSHLSTASVSAYERSERTPKAKALCALARTLGCAPNDLDPWYPDRDGPSPGAAVGEGRGDYIPGRPCPPEIREICDAWPGMSATERAILKAFAAGFMPGVQKRQTDGAKREDAHTA